MILAENIKTGWHQLMLNKGKSFLTMLGIIIGIFSVIYMMTIGQSVKNFLISQIESIGTNTIMVMPTSVMEGETVGQKDFSLTMDDVEALRESELASHLEAVSGMVSYTGKATYESAKKTYDVYLSGLHPDGKIVSNYKLIQGRFFTQAEYDQNARVMVLLENDAETLFGDKNAVGQELKVDDKKFTIIGVLEKQSSMQPSMGYIQPVVPLTTVQSLFNNNSKDVTYILAKVDDKNNIPSTVAAMKNILNQRHPTGKGEDAPVEVQSMDSFLSIFNNVLLGIQLFLSLIAAISLLVGGIGIMNIMLMTVKERTKEIGLRKAIGAKRSNILVQFLVESVVITIIGGVIGIIAGIAFSAITVFIVNLAMPDWGVFLSISWIGVILSCTVSILTGILFGLYPAIKASRLSPIEALRYE
ncbi:MAG: ABC transporter permease [Patescibacteria group bacterium]|jgi:putative ABC transport system permease protein